MATKPNAAGFPKEIVSIITAIDGAMKNAGRKEKVDVDHPDFISDEHEDTIRQYIKTTYGWGEVKFNDHSVGGHWIAITGNPVLGKQNDSEVSKFEQDIDDALTTAKFVNNITRINISIPVALRKAVGDLYRPHWKNVTVTGSYIELEK